jgi:hypothetical protein
VYNYVIIHFIHENRDGMGLLIVTVFTNKNAKGEVNHAQNQEKTLKIK